MNKEYCGFIPIIGKTNVGKSTLLNKIINKKISITSRKSNTTQQCIKGIYNNKIFQSIYIDTPGFYIKKQKIIKNNIVNSADLVIFVIAGTSWDIEDEIICKYLKYLNKLVLIVINKLDLIKDKSSILPHISFLKKK